MILKTGPFHILSVCLNICLLSSASVASLRASGHAKSSTPLSTYARPSRHCHIRIVKIPDPMTQCSRLHASPTFYSVPALLASLPVPLRWFVHSILQRARTWWGMAGLFCACLPLRLYSPTSRSFPMKTAQHLIGLEMAHSFYHEAAYHQRVLVTCCHRAEGQRTGQKWLA